MINKTKLSSAVEKTVTMTLSDNNAVKPKNGRPILSIYERLFSDTYISYKEYAELNEEMIKKIDISSVEDSDKKSKLSRMQQKRMQVTNSIVSIESKIKTCKSTSLKEKLNTSRDNKIKQLRNLPEEGELSTDTDKINTVGKPKLPIVIYYARAKSAFESELKKLNRYENRHHIFPSNITDFKEKLEESKNKPKIGRPNSAEIDILDTELKSILNTIYQIRQNIEEENLSESLKLGRKKRSHEALAKEEKKQDYIVDKILKLESQMSHKQLMRRQIKQQKKLITTAKKKMKYASEHEILLFNRQIFDNNMKIKELNMKLEQLDSSPKKIVCEPDFVKANVEITQSKEDKSSQLISIDDLFSQIKSEKAKLDDSAEFLTDLVKKLAANDKLKVA